MFPLRYLRSVRADWTAIFAVSSLLCFAGSPAWGNACQSTATGNWGTAGTWTTCGGTTPQPTDTVTIASGNNVTVNVSPTVSALTMASPTAANSLIIATGENLTVTNALTFTANATVNGSTITLQGTGNLNAGSIVTSASTSTGASKITCAGLATGTLTVSGSISLVGSGVTASSGAMIDFGTTPTGCNVVASSITLNGGAVSAGLIKLSTGTLTLNGPLNGIGTVAKAQLTTVGAGTLVLNNASIGTGETLAINAGTNLTSTGISSVTYATAIATWGSLAVQGSTLTYNVVAATFTGINLSNNGTLAVGTINLTNSGNFTNGGMYSGSAGLTMNGTSSVLDGTGTYTNTGTLTLNTAAKSFASTANLSFSGTVSIVGAITVTNNGTVTIPAAGGVTGSVAGSTWVNSTNAVINDAGPLLAVGTLTATANPNTVDYNGAAQTVNPTSYYNLILNGTGAKTMTSVTTVNGNFTANGGTATAPLTSVGGNFIVDGGTPTLSGALTVSGSLTVSSGTLTTGAVALTIVSTTGVSGGVLTLPAGAGNKTFEGLVTVNGGTMSGASTDTVVQGGMTQTSGSVAMTGTVMFNANSQALNGTFSITTSSVATGITLTNNGSLTSTTLVVAGSLTNAATITATTLTDVGTLTNNGTVTASGVTTITGSFINNSTMNANSTLTGAGSWTQGTNSNLNAAGGTTNAMAVTTVDFTTNVNSVTYNGAAQTIKAASYNYLAFSGSAAKTMTGVSTINDDLALSGTATATPAAALSIGGNLIIGSGTTFTPANFALGISGDTTVNGTMSGAGTGTVTANGDVIGSGTVNLTGGTLEQRVSANQNFGQTSGSNNWNFKFLTFSNGGSTPVVVTTETGGSGGITVSSMTVGKLGDAVGATTTLDPADVPWTITGTGASLGLTASLGSLCNPATCVDNVSTFSYTGNGATTIAASTAYYNLVSSPTLTANAIYSAGGAIGVANNFTLNPTAASGGNRVLTLNLNGGLTVGGWLDLDGTVSACSSMTTTTSNYAITASSITIQPGIGTCTDNLVANGSLITLTGAGTPFIIGGTLASFIRNTSTVSYTGNGATIAMLSGTVSSNTYTNLALMPGGSSPLIIGAGTLEVNGNLIIGDGTNTGATASGNPTINLHGDLTIAANALYTKGTGTTFFKKGGTENWTDNTTGQQDLGTVQISVNTTNTTVNLGSSVQATDLTINASQALSLNGTNTLFLSTLTNAGTLTGSTGIINLAGTGTPFSNTGTFTYNTSTVAYVGSGATITALSGSAGTNGYYNLNLQPGGGVAQILGTAANQIFQINNNLTIGDGTNAGATGAANNPTIKVANDTIISPNATFSAPSSSMTFGGDWLNSGTFTANNSTVTFIGAAVENVSNNGQAFAVMVDSNISSGGLVFPSGFSATIFTVNGAALTHATTLYFDAGSTYTVTGLNLIGSSGKMVFIRSSINGQQWFLNNTSTNSIAYVDVEDSNANAGQTIIAGGTSIDSTDNANWSFLVISISLSPSTYSFGSIALATSTVATSAITVTNGGSNTETFSISVATTGAKSVWAVATATPTAADTFAMFNLFNTVQPSSTTFNNLDIVISTPTTSTSSVYAGNQNGVSVAASATRNLWTLLDMPLTTSTTDQEQMNLTVSASYP